MWVLVNARLHQERAKKRGKSMGEGRLARREKLDDGGTTASKGISVFAAFQHVYERRACAPELNKLWVHASQILGFV